MVDFRSTYFLCSCVQPTDSNEMIYTHTIERYAMQYSIAQRIKRIARSQNHYHINCTTPKNFCIAHRRAKWKYILIILCVSTHSTQYTIQYVFVRQCVLLCIHKPFRMDFGRCQTYFQRWHVDF